MSKLILIDGNAILHRAYHALPPLTSKKGEPIGAVYGFISMLLRVVQDLKPTHITVAFDTAKPTFRHVAYVGYQAQRPRVDSELGSQFKIAKEVLESFGIPTFAAPGFEADDVIGTLAFQALTINHQPSTINHCLILGLGGGTVAKLVRKKWPEAKITGVDIDPIMVELGEKYLGLREFDVDTKIGDAFDYLIKYQSSAINHFDLIIADLYNGDKYPEKFETSAFLSPPK